MVNTLSLRCARHVVLERDFRALDLVEDPLLRRLVAVREQVVEERRDHGVREDGAWVGEALGQELC